MRRHACAYLIVLATARALRAAPRMILLPGASTGRISEEEARARTGWVHWTKKEAVAAAPPPTPAPQLNRESDRAADAAPATPQNAYTLAYFQDRVKARARKEALLGLVAATGRLCGGRRGGARGRAPRADRGRRGARRAARCARAADRRLLGRGPRQWRGGGLEAGLQTPL